MIAPAPSPGRRAGPWPPSWLAGYGSVHVGKSLLWAGEDALTLYIATRFLGLAPWLAGSLFLASALWNAVCDGALGMALRRFVRLRRVMPAMAGVAVLASGVGFAALPFVARGDAVLAAVLLFVFRTGFSAVDVPHNGLTRRIAARRGHLGVARLRAVGSGGAALAVGGAAFVILRSGTAEIGTIRLTVGAVAVVAMLLMAPLPLLLAADETPVPAVPPVPARAIDGAFWRYCLATGLGVAGVAAGAKALMHLQIAATAAGAWLPLMLAAARLGGVWIWTPVAHAWGNRAALAASYLACGLGMLAVPLLATVPDAGPVAIALTTGAAGGGVAFVSWAVLSETLGTRRDGADPDRYVAAFGAFTMTMKIALGLSAVVTGGWLSLAGGSAGIGAGIGADAFWPLAGVAVVACLAAAALILQPGRPARTATRSAGIAAPTAPPLASIASPEPARAITHA